jgi:hypothetical protein
MEYDVEEVEGYFENYFAVNCQKFVVTIDYPDDIDPPIAYEVNSESGEIKRCRIQPVIKTKGNNNSNNNRNLASWVKRNIFQGQSFRFEWKQNNLFKLQ